METGTPRAELRGIFDAAVSAVEPGRLIARALAVRGDRVDVSCPNRPPSVVLRGVVGVFGAGKAAGRMAAAFEQSCGQVLDVAGAVVVPVGTELPKLEKIVALPGEHPVPGPLGRRSTQRLVEGLGSRSVDHVVCLFSGGASSLLVAPMPPLELGEVRKVTELLLQSGAAIDEINWVRKHLSTLKGGRMLRLVRGRPVLSLLLSDVVGDDPATIGSGPAVPDESTFTDAIDVLRKYGVYESCPQPVRDVLIRGLRGEIEETVRPGSPEAGRASSIILGSNATAIAAAAGAAAQLGYEVIVRDGPLIGDTTEAALDWFLQIERRREGGASVCLIAGGETTVRVRGRGKGGRNQEFALALVEATRGLAATILSCGTDGIDGPTSAAGAFVDGSTADRARARGLDPAVYLAENDSFNFFDQLGDLFTTGPTGTNVMDLKIALIRPPSSI